MPTKPKMPPGSTTGLTSLDQPFTGYCFKVPSEIDRLMDLEHAELKVYLPVTQTIQRDRNEGLLAISQIARRADLSERHARKAIHSLCRPRMLIRVNPVTRAQSTNETDWNGRTVTCANPIQWRQKDTSNLGPTAQRSGSDDDYPDPLRNDVTDSRPADSHPAPTGEGNLRPVGERYLRPRPPSAPELLKPTPIGHSIEFSLRAAFLSSSAPSPRSDTA